MRLELTRVGLLVKLANHYTTKGALDNFCIAIERRLHIFDGHICMVRVHARAIMHNHELAVSLHLNVPE